MNRTFFFDLSLLDLDTVKYLYVRFEAVTSESAKAFEAEDIRSFQSFFDAEENQKVHFLAYLAALLAHGLVQVKSGESKDNSSDSKKLFYLELDQPEDFDQTWFTSLQEKDNLVELIKVYKLDTFSFMFKEHDFWIAQEDKDLKTLLTLLSFFKPDDLEHYLTYFLGDSVTHQDFLEDEEALDVLLKLLVLGGLYAQGHVQPDEEMEWLPVMINDNMVAVLDSSDFDYLNEFGGATFISLIKGFELEGLKERLMGYDMLHLLRKMECRRLLCPNVTTKNI